MTIPIKTTPAQFRRYVDNVVAAYQETTPDQRTRGANWYPNANLLCQFLDSDNPKRAAGVIASLSANKSWMMNVELAKRAYSLDQPSGHVADALRKVARIMAGERPEDVLPMEMKTGCFYRLVADPDNPHTVCIDRHAFDIAVGEVYGDRERGLSARGRYNLIADVYREAARLLGVQPATLQATTWIAHREKLAGTGSRGELKDEM